MSNPANASEAPPVSRIRRSGGARLAGLKATLTLVVVVAAVLGVYYIFYVVDEREYLIGRNFRLLASVTERLESAVESAQRVVAHTLGGVGYGSVKEAGRSLEMNAKYVSILRTAEVRPRSDLGANSAKNVAVQFVERTSQKQWIVRQTEPMIKELLFQLQLDDLLDRALRGQAQEGAFEALLVATTKGRILFQTGASALRITDLARLVLPGDAKAASSPSFAELAQSSAVVDVLVSGSRYKLFVRPCCGRVEDATSGDAGWVVCGLMSHRALNDASYSVPSSMMALIGAALVLSVLSWPFVKLLLIGELDRVRAHDVALVGLCLLVGIAGLMISVLGLHGYSLLNTRLDAQLARLAGEIKRQANAEMDAARKELVLLDAAVADKRLPEGDIVRNLARNARALTEEYPFFESFSLIDDAGLQRRKVSMGEFVPPLVDVKDRGYFLHWKRPSSSGFFFEAIQSKTTGRRQVVLSKPAAAGAFKVAALSIPMRTLIRPVIVPGFAFVIIDDEGNVLFHSDPRHSGPENFFVESDNNRRVRALVAAERTDWVDADYWAGDHRAFVSPMKILDQQVTVVTLYDKALARAVNVAWLVIVAVFLLLYAGVYAALFTLVMLVAPRYRAPWLWPDPSGSRRYLDLLPPLLLLAFAFVAAIAKVSPGTLLLVAWLLPFLAWVVVYVVLGADVDGRHRGRVAVIGLGLLVPLGLLASRVSPLRWGLALGLLMLGSVVLAVMAARRRGNAGSAALPPPPNLSYALAAVLLVLLVAVLPAAAFGRVGYAMQIESFIKHAQRQAAVNRAARADLDAQDRLAGLLGEARRQHGRQGWGVYDSFFFPSESASRPAQSATDDDNRLPQVIEELLPFYSESSVRFRGLAFDTVDGRDWFWTREGDELVFHSSGTGFTLRSTLPGFLDVSTRGLRAGQGRTAPATDWPTLALLLLGTLGVIAAVIWAVKFVIHNVFVADVIEPLWSGRDPAAETWASNLFVVNAAPPARRLQPDSYCDVDLAAAPGAGAEVRRWFDHEFERIQRSPAGNSVLILHFEERLDDARFNEARLDFLERILNQLNRTIVVVSAAPPSVAMQGRHSADGTETAEPPPDLTMRWADVLSRFTVIPAVPWRQVPEEPSGASVLTTAATGGWREIVWRLSLLGFAHRARFLDRERDDPEVDRLWKKVLPYAWHPGRPPLDLGQLLVEVGERAENHYREIWATCTPAEKRVLVHVAQEGLVNRRTSATARRLMARGLIRREPNFVLANETFRRFVLSSVSQKEVALLERPSASTWGVVRLPFLGTLVGSLAFLFVTQQDLFNTSLGVLTAVTAAVPTVMKVAGLFGDRRAGE